MKNKIILAIVTMFMCASFTNVKPTNVEILCNETWIPVKHGIPDPTVRINFCSNNVYKMTFLYKEVVVGDTIIGNWSINNLGKITISINEFEKILYLSNICESTLTLKTENNEFVEYSSKIK